MLLKILESKKQQSKGVSLYEKRKRDIFRIYAQHVIKLAKERKKKAPSATMTKGDK